jgi:hypothetical protein
MKHTRSRARFAAAALALLSLGAAGCAGGAGGPTPSATVSTAIQGWERYFRLEYEPQARPNGIELEGYAYNQYGTPMANVQILGQALDGAGNVVGQRLAWVHGVVPALNRSYFKVGGLPRAERYRATVWAFDILDSGSLPRP